MTTIRNSTFKCKPETVGTLIGVVPESGAMIFLSTDKRVYFGDGAVWQPVGVDTSSNIVVVSADSIDHVLTENTPADFVWFDTLDLKRGSDVTVDIVPPVSITFNADLLIQFSVDFKLASSIGGTNIVIKTFIGGVEFEPLRQVVKTSGVGEPSFISLFSYLQFSSADVVTWTIEADKDCTITLSDSQMGFQQV
jgi:hypothetical protein